MFIWGELSQCFQYGADCRSCGLKRLVQALPALEHPYLIAHEAFRADAVLRDLNERRALPCFELNDLGHTNRL